LASSTRHGGCVGNDDSGVIFVPLSCTATNITGTRASGGNQGAYAGSGTTANGSCFATGSVVDDCGTTINSSGTLIGGGGNPNPGGQGGSILSATQNQTISGGGWGLAGAGGGGAGGAAISGTYASLTDSGTIYGSV
jgi:hypothetical protein